MDKINSKIDFKNIYDKYYHKLVIHSYRIVYKNDVAEDIVQNCFIKLWEKRNEIRADVSLDFYLIRMVKNKSIDYLRKNKTRVLELDENINIENEEIETADSKHEKNAGLRPKIQEALDNLPERCRQVFMLSRYEKMTYKEISEELNISPKTVEAHIIRALKGFRISLKQYLIIFIKKTKGV